MSAMPAACPAAGTSPTDWCSDCPEEPPHRRGACPRNVKVETCWKCQRVPVFEHLHPLGLCRECRRKLADDA